MRPSLIRPTAMFLFGYLLIGGLAKGGAEDPAAPPPAIKKVGKSLTEEECLAFGEAINNAVYDANVEAFDKLIDWETVYRRCTEGIDAPEQFRSDFVKGLAESRTKGKNFAKAIMDVIKKGGSYALIHNHSKEGGARLLFRLVTTESGVNYHDYSLSRQQDGAVKADDIYFYMKGETLSQSLRSMYKQTVANQNGGRLARFFGMDQSFLVFAKKLGAMSEANRAGKYKEAMEIYQSIPAEHKKQKPALLLRLEVAQHLGDDGEYLKSIDEFRAIHPDDACIDMLSIDFFLLKKQYREGLACIDRLDRAVAGDPYLQIIRARVHAEQGDLATSRTYLNKALESDPDLYDGYWSLVSLSILEGKYDETFRTLRLIRDKFKVEIGDLTTEPSFKGFTESPQYQEWLKDGREAGTERK